MADRQAERALIAYLVAGARVGDRPAMEQLFALVSPRLLAHAGRLLGEAEPARDAAQDAWIEILRGISRLRDDRAFMPWALRIVSRRVARLIKGRQRDRETAKDWITVSDISVESAGPAASDALAVRAAIDALSPTHRATIALFYLEDMSVREVATALDVPIGTVKTRLMHARAQLKQILKGEQDEET